MQKTIYNTWNVVMNHNINPLRNITNTHIRHIVMQILALMWCVAFSMYFGSMWIFGLMAIAHCFIIGAIVVTVATFHNARTMNWTYHTPSRSRAIYMNGKRYELDEKDVGGEHE